MTDKQEVISACSGLTHIFHIAALVGPYVPKALYYDVNYQGTLNVLEGARKHKVGKFVMSSSPSTRFTGVDIEGKREDEVRICKGKRIPRQGGWVGHPSIP